MEPKKSVLKINLLLLRAIFLCFFLVLFHFLVIFTPVTGRSAYNVKNDVLTQKVELEKQRRDNRSRIKLFTWFTPSK